MRPRQNHHLSRYALLMLLLAAASACGSKTPYDWKNREIAWVYGPTSGGATSEHLKGTGSRGPGPIAVGWKCRLSDGNKLTVKPYQLSKSHALFGKAKMIIGLFNKGGEKIDTVRTDTITAKNATFSLEIKEDVAKPLWDVVIWFAKA